MTVFKESNNYMKYILWTVISRTACAFVGNWDCDTGTNNPISTSPSPSNTLSRSSRTKNHFYCQLHFWSMRSLEKEEALLASDLPCKGWDTTSLSWCLWRLQACLSRHWRRAPHLYTLWECYRGKSDKLETTSVTALTHTSITQGGGQHTRNWILSQKTQFWRGPCCFAIEQTVTIYAEWKN